MKIRLNLGDTIVTATLENSATSRDFFSLLPLSLTLRDYAATEKISELPRRLDTNGAPPGVDPTVGDIAYYAPWGNLAVFYKDSGYARGLIKLGRIDTDVQSLSRPGTLRATIERFGK